MFCDDDCMYLTVSWSLVIPKKKRTTLETWKKTTNQQSISVSNYNVNTANEPPATRDVTALYSSMYLTSLNDSALAKTKRRPFRQTSTRREKSSAPFKPPVQSSMQKYVAVNGQLL